MLTKMVKWFTPAGVLKMATANNAELLALSGERSPYPGKLGVIEPGALADLLLVNGDPIAEMNLSSETKCPVLGGMPSRRSGAECTATHCLPV